MTRELDCKTVSRLLSDGHDLQMAPAERARLRLHLVICTACRNVDAQFRFLRDAMRRLDKDKPPKD
jgi:predicted anti-sigma-YlaC factor YlaD